MYCISYHSSTCARDLASVYQAQVAAVITDVDLVCEDPCRENPCVNFGECVAQDNGYGYTCDCLPGYGGVHCEIGTF